MICNTQDPIEEPKKRRDQAREEKKTDESEEVDDPIPKAKRPKSSRSDLQKEALTSHTRMCEKAMSTLERMESLFEKREKTV